MKNSRAKSNSRISNKPEIKRKPRSSMPALLQRGVARRRFVEFPGVKGRLVEKIELFTMPEFHSITIYFQDKRALNLVLEPSLLVSSNFSDNSTGDQQVLKRWPSVRTVTNRD